MSFNQITQSRPAKTPEQHVKRIVQLGSPAKRAPKAAQKLRNAFFFVETKQAGRLIIGVN